MLVLSRKPGEQLKIGNNITLTVLEIHGRTVKLGISAPRDVPVLRAELQRLLEIAKEPANHEPAPATVAV
jgi:carbon storage regulator